MSKARAETFQHLRKMIANLQNNEELAKSAAAIGVDAAMLGRGRAMLERAEQHDQQYQHLKKNLTITAATLKSTRNVLRQLYLRHRHIARLEITDTTIRTRLDLDEELKTTKATQLEQYRSFYAAALDGAELQAALAEAGLTQAKLTVGRTLVAEVDQLITGEINLRATKEQATADLLRQTRQMRAWIHATTTLVRLGAAEHPQLLKAISHEVRTGRRTAAET